MVIETMIQAYYEGKIETENDFENNLEEVPKEELIDFIINQQSHGAFKNFQELGSYNQKYQNLYGKEEEEK